MSDKLSNNKRIAKNTILLYGRMLLMMVISLYTSRVILNALGVEDYGIYNVVGGVVAMFSIISGSLSASISRFITFELGKEDYNRLKTVFCTSVNLQLILIIIVTILLESIGLWFLNYKMVIPSNRLYAANWVFQFSVVTFAVNLWSVPYNAAIIAHERMSAFAYISLFDATAKLLVAYIIYKNPFDRLVYYASLILLIGVIQRLLYTIYCRRHFEECEYEFIFDKKVTRQMFSFAGWNFIGASASILNNQGVNLVINLFFGPVINASRGIAVTINNSVLNFVSNFMMALTPQITKSYASGDRGYMFDLVFQGARLSYYILLVFALPIIVTTPFLLHLWLGTVPDHAVNFTRLTLLFALSETLANPLVTVMLATGNIRNYQIAVGGIQLLNLPVDYFLLTLNFTPESVFVVAVFFSVLSEMVRLIMLRKMVDLSIGLFLKKVYFNVIIVSVLSSVLPFAYLSFYKVDDIGKFMVACCISFVSTILVIYIVGCNSSDRQILHSVLLKIKGKFR